MEKNNETPEVFQDNKQENELNPEELGIVSNQAPVFLVNIGRPVRRTILNQKKISWLDSIGRRLSVEIVRYRDFDDKANSDAKKIRLGEDEKCLIYYDSAGHVISKKIVSDSFSFDIFDYPHVIEYPIGNDKFNERRYTLKCGTFDPKTLQISSDPIPTFIENSDDAKELIRRFGFLSECDKNGKPASKSSYIENLGKTKIKQEGSIDWSGMEEVSSSQLPTRQPRKDGVNKKGLINDKDLEESE